MNLRQWTGILKHLPPSAGRRDSFSPIRGPWDGRHRVAAIASWFPVERRVKAFDAISRAALEAFRPEIIAAPIPDLRRLAEMRLGGEIRLEGLSRGFLALVGVGRPPIAQRDRDLLWRAFSLPVYAEFRGWTGSLLATECEAFDGLHVIEENAVFGQCHETGEIWVTAALPGRIPRRAVPTGLRGVVESAPCPCRRPGPRLAGLQLAGNLAIPVMTAGASS